MISLVVGLVLVSDVVGTAIVSLIIVGATSPFFSVKLAYVCILSFCKDKVAPSTE